MTIHVFTYGTLRPGGALNGTMPGEHIGPAFVPDARLYRHFGARYPVIDLSPTNPTSADIVRGDVFRASYADLDFVAEMEIGAGYDPVWRTVVYTDDDAELRTATALVFGWPDHLPVGPYIASGDWHGTDAQRICSELPTGAGFATRSRR